ncbi:MAG: PDZ domain-containing protein, partial [Verrucomicrobiota bacterium]
VMIVKVLPGSAAEGHLKPGDIVLSLEGHSVADDGTVEFRPNERTSLSYYVQSHQIGESMDLEVLRDGKTIPMSLTLKQSLTSDWLVPMEAYDVLPTYFIYGGIVFCPLTKNLLKAWGPGWYGSAPKPWVSLINRNYASDEIDEVVIALKVLAADVNEGYHKFTNWVVDKVNGERVTSMKDLVKKIESESDAPFVVISNEIDQKIVLNRRKVTDSTDRILQTYRIRSDRSENLKNL